MAEFCKCGSVVIGGSCTNKNCSNRPVKSVASTRVRKTGKTKTTASVVEEKPVQKSSKIQRASKCITYHISELPQKEQHN